MIIPLFILSNKLFGRISKIASLEMEGKGNWDFRSESEINLSNNFTNKGYVIEQANIKHLELIKATITSALNSYILHEDIGDMTKISLENVHNFVPKINSNKLRLFIMKEISHAKEFNQNYFLAAKDMIYQLCGNELAMQKRAGLSVNFPNNEADVLPIHADTWNGVSPYELNIWIPLVDSKKSMCLYILKRDKYQDRIERSPHLLRLTSDELFEELKSEMTWIEIKYGQLLAFDQSLPHGFCINEESTTHWSLNCRFKGLNTPYWDKKLGEYFMPITVKCCTKIGMNYKHPIEWL